MQVAFERMYACSGGDKAFGILTDGLFWVIWQTPPAGSSWLRGR